MFAPRTVNVEALGMLYPNKNYSQKSYNEDYNIIENQRRNKRALLERNNGCEYSALFAAAITPTLLLFSVTAFCGCLGEKDRGSYAALALGSAFLAGRAVNVLSSYNKAITSAQQEINTQTKTQDPAAVRDSMQKIHTTFHTEFKKNLGKGVFGLGFFPILDITMGKKIPKYTANVEEVV